MGILYTLNYDEKPVIKEIKIEKFPVVIITDTHTNISHIRTLIEKYKNNQFICLGDIVFLWGKSNEDFNSNSIQYFINSKIPCLKGNHDEHVSEDVNKYNITFEQQKFLKDLPDGFKLVLPDGSNYLCFHSRPKDKWGRINKENFTEEEFKNTYPIDSKTKAVLLGHHHENFEINYPNINCSLIGVGRLSKDGDFAIINEDGIERKKIC